eukprot:s5291_g4.t2
MTTRLLKLGYVQHSFDKMVFLKRDQSGQLLSIIIVYVDVDDFLGVYRKDYNISEVHDAFVWGALNFFKLNEPLTFKGKELTLKLNSRGRHILVITQKESIHGLDSGKIPKGAELTEPLTPEQGELRSVASCLQWLCGQSRPELSPSVSLNSLSSKSTLANLGSLYFALDFAEETSNYGLVLPDAMVADEAVDRRAPLSRFILAEKTPKLDKRQRTIIQVCRRPCIYFLAGHCENGNACAYCHLPHMEKTPKLDKRQRTIIQGLSRRELLALVLEFCRTKAEQVGFVEEASEVLGMLEAESASARALPASISDRDIRNLHKTLARMNFSNLIGLVTHQSPSRPGNASESSEQLMGALERRGLGACGPSFAPFRQASHALPAARDVRAARKALAKRSRHELRAGAMPQDATALVKVCRRASLLRCTAEDPDAHA